MKNISIQYQDLKEGKMNRHQFLRNARMMFPNHVTQFNSFDDSVKILKQKGLLNEGDAVQGAPDKAPTYKYPNEATKYKKVEQSPEVDEQDGIYPATTLTDIPKEKMDKKVKDKSSGLEPIKPHDTKNEMKKVKVVKEAIDEAEDIDDDGPDVRAIPPAEKPQKQITIVDIMKAYYDEFKKNPRASTNDIARNLNVSPKEVERIMMSATTESKQPEDKEKVLKETIKGIVRKALDKK